MTIWNIVHQDNNFMQFYVVMDHLLIVFNGLNLIIVALIILLFKLVSCTCYSIAIQTRNASRNNDYDCESKFCDTGSRATKSGSDNLAKPLIITNAIRFKTTHGVKHFAHANNSIAIDDYLHIGNDSNNKTLFPALRDVNVNWLVIIAMCE